MKINWAITNSEPTPIGKKEDDLKKLEIEKISVGHTNSEVYLKFEDSSIVMTPSTSKKMVEDLNRVITDFEKKYGKIKLPKKQGKKRESTVSRVVRSLYKGKKVSSNLIAVNTKRKKNLPFKGD